MDVGNYIQLDLPILTIYSSAPIPVPHSLVRMHGFLFGLGLDSAGGTSQSTTSQSRIYVLLLVTEKDKRRSGEATIITLQLMRRVTQALKEGRREGDFFLPGLPEHNQKHKDISISSFWCRWSTRLSSRFSRLSSWLSWWALPSCLSRSSCWSSRLSLFSRWSIRTIIIRSKGGSVKASILTKTSNSSSLSFTSISNVGIISKAISKGISTKGIGKSRDQGSSSRGRGTTKGCVLSIRGNAIKRRQVWGYRTS